MKYQSVKSDSTIDFYFLAKLNVKKEKSCYTILFFFCIYNMYRVISTVYKKQLDNKKGESKNTGPSDMLHICNNFGIS